ncbi:unnamed protein product [Heterosigma akashiwo]|uniref:Uncharacterized protein n=1 Tax=Heterosigma akashiwo TaxID=2829 RepID=A0A6V2ZPH3_HETAK|mmetsp:Transcript_21761/g.37418  ORF Transcript_21761/g.37418 Transcript_21761/m.37418 type:complete len:206 (+) Transcript_21761:58-675(+)|eukprot:CAMPEP_0194574412 /NCGR_PEP_ID=MMETSP0292-20121207/10276_1 /TAXON_ID=39354 /ORGANISM="Heterosigma akashiwo, Strain CCMP2393" /LENGTH=205 /DNA_ID=CAMNT_0039425933 /DNA_START=60 /DNA_END=680 /DNA_ORIENTATION=+
MCQQANLFLFLVLFLGAFTTRSAEAFVSSSDAFVSSSTSSLFQGSTIVRGFQCGRNSKMKRARLYGSPEEKIKEVMRQQMEAEEKGELIKAAKLGMEIKELSRVLLGELDQEIFNRNVQTKEQASNADFGIGQRWAFGYSSAFVGEKDEEQSQKRGRQADDTGPKQPDFGGFGKKWAFGYETTSSPSNDDEIPENKDQSGASGDF